MNSQPGDGRPHGLARLRSVPAEVRELLVGIKALPCQPRVFTCHLGNVGHGPDLLANVAQGEAIQRLAANRAVELSSCPLEVASSLLLGGHPSRTPRRHRPRSGLKVGVLVPKCTRIPMYRMFPVLLGQFEGTCTLSLPAGTNPPRRRRVIFPRGKSHLHPAPRRRVAGSALEILPVFVHVLGEVAVVPAGRRSPLTRPCRPRRASLAACPRSSHVVQVVVAFGIVAASRLAKQGAAETIFGLSEAGVVHLVAVDARWVSQRARHVKTDLVPKLRLPQVRWILLVARRQQMVGHQMSGLPSRRPLQVHEHSVAGAFS